MSGSLSWRTYTTDAGTQVSVFRDDTNANAVASTSTGAILGAFVTGLQGLSSLVRPRYVNTRLSTNAIITKRFPIGTLATYNAIVGGTTITEAGAGGLTWAVTSKVGERARLPTALNTGQTT